MRELIGTEKFCGIKRIFDIIKKEAFIVYRVFRNTHELILINVLIIRKGTHDYSNLRSYNRGNKTNSYRCIYERTGF